MSRLTTPGPGPAEQPPPAPDADVRLLAAMAEPTRLAILRQLAALPEVCACDFTSCTGVTQPTVSHHLKVLREAGWIVGERRGTWIFYRLAPDAARMLGTIAASVSPAQITPTDPSRRRLNVLQA